MRRRVLTLGMLCVVAVARAHPLAPGLLELHEGADGQVQIAWKAGALKAAGVPFEPALVPACAVGSAPTVTAGEGSVLVRWMVECGSAGLVGRGVEIRGLSAAKTEVLLRATLADGRTVQRVLSAATPTLVIPDRPQLAAVVRDYLRLGIEHILTGADHLAFVLALMLLAGGLRPLLGAITGFTVGHSLTLSLAVLGLVRLPPQPIEILIAATVLMLAVELASPRAHPRTRWGGSWGMALACGLLHGLGFAGALRAAGLPEGDVPLALVSFNGGVEIGQLLFVTVVWAAGRAFRPMLHGASGWLRHGAAYAIGSLAAYWCLVRAVALIG